MSVKALWFKEYRQARGLIWTIVGLLTGLLTVRVMLQLGQITAFTRTGQYPEIDTSYVDVGLPFFVLPLLAITLACLQIGAERSREGDHFTFSLPFDRRLIFAAKWALGASVLALALGVNGMLMHVLIATSRANVHVLANPEVAPTVAQMLVATLATYTLAMWSGAFTGHVAFQAAFSLIFGIFPAGFVMLLNESIGRHVLALGRNPYLSTAIWPGQQAAEHWALVLSPLAHFTMGGRGWETVRMLAPADLALTAVFFVWGAHIYSRNRLELNGRMLVIPGARRFFLTGITVCFALLGGLVGLGRGWSPASSTLAEYYLGAAVAGGLAYAVTARLLGLRGWWTGRRRPADTPGA